MRQLLLTPDMTFTVFLDFMQEVYNRKLVFDYQDRSGRVHKVETLEAFEAFCAAADNGAPPGHKPEVTVFLRDWKYTEPRFVGPPAPPQYVPPFLCFLSAPPRLPFCRRAHTLAAYGQLSDTEEISANQLKQCVLIALARFDLACNRPGCPQNCLRRSVRRGPVSSLALQGYWGSGAR